MKIKKRELYDDEYLFNEAVAIIKITGKVSTSSLQRRLKIGYGRAARIMDLLEVRDVISPLDGIKRKILI